MIKSKIMLTVMALISVLSILLSFKAQNAQDCFLYTGELGSGACTTKVIGVTIAIGNPVVAASTIPTTSGCPDVYITDCNLDRPE